MANRPNVPDRPKVPVPSQHAVTDLPARRPGRPVLTGHWCRLEPLEVEAHADELTPHAVDPAARESWAYMPDGPFDTAADYRAHLARQAASDDPLFFAVRDGDAGRAARGVAALMSIVPDHGRIEIGNIWFAPALQRTRAASEAVMLLAIHAFDLGYRRLEWKCNAANAGSRRAALRFGFAFEGIHRRHMAVKGRNRDTAWYSIVQEEWPAVRAAYEAWRDPANFDAQGRQKTRLAAAPKDG
jgi:RimJ/RimL family protein N-acetyltransferase